jgi:hypothetical protein
MLPSECPYPESVQNANGHPVGSSLSEGTCIGCQRYFRRCADCQAANRWLARFCRNCGHSLRALNWLPEHIDTPVHGRPLIWPTSWHGHLECGFRPLWLGLLDGRIFVLGNRGEVRLLARDPWRLEQPYPANPIQASSPTYMHGFLAIPSEDQIALIDLLENRSSGSRRVQRLRGPLLCPIASDQGHWLAALVQEAEHRNLQLFRLHNGRLQLAWNQVLEAPAAEPNRFPRLLWTDELLVYLREDGELLGLEAGSGQERFRLHCPCPPAPLAPWVKHGNCYWAGADGSLWWLKLTPELQLHQLSPSQALPILALSVGPHDLIASLGRSLQRLHLQTSRIEVFELPQYCTVSPWVGAQQALALCQEGQLYLLSLGKDTFQVEATDKMPAPFATSLLPPLWTGREWVIVDSDGRVFLSA